MEVRCTDRMYDPDQGCEDEPDCKALARRQGMARKFERACMNVLAALQHEVV